MLKTWIRLEVTSTESDVFLVFVASDTDGNRLSTGSTYIHNGNSDYCAGLVEAYKKIGLPVEVVYYGNVDKHKYDYLESAD